MSTRAGRDGARRRPRLDFTAVADVARGIAAATLSEAGERGTFNLAAGHARSLREAIDVVRAHGRAVAVELSTPGPRACRGTLHISRARDRLGYRPRHTLEDGLAACLEAALALAPA